MRVHTRLSLSALAVARILEDELAVDIGIEPGTDRVHWLFYSQLDAQCFVAVVDRVNAVVITILPLTFHENLAWRVSDEAQAQARAMMGVGPERF